MAILEILQYPDNRLNTPAQRVEKIDADKAYTPEFYQSFAAEVGWKLG